MRISLPPLKYSIPIGIFVFNSILFLFNIKVDYNNALDDLKKQVIMETKRQSLLASSMIETNLREHDLSKINDVLSNISGFRDVEFAIIVDENEKIMVASKIKFEDKYLSEIIENKIRQEIINVPSKIIYEDSTECIWSASELYLGFSEENLLPENKGKLIIKRVLSSRIIAKKNEIVTSLYINFFIFVLFSLTLWFFFYQLYTKRANKIINAIKKKENLDLKGNDEFSLLSREFSKMWNQLSENEEKFRAIFENSLSAIVVVDDLGNYVDANISAQKIFGFSKSELKLKNIINMQSERDGINSRSLDAFIKRGQQKGEFEFIREDGAERTALYNATRIYKDFNIYVLMDITELKRNQQEMLRKNEFIQTVLDNLPIGIALNTIDEGKASYINKKFEEIYGWPADEMRDIHEFFEKVYPDKAYRESIQKRIYEDIKSGDINRMNWDGIKIITKDGKEKIIYAANIPLPEQNVMVSTVMDETEKKLAEEALIKNEARLKEAQEIAQMGNFELDIKTEKMEWSDEIYDLLEIDKSRKALSLSEIKQFVVEDDRWKLEFYKREILQTRRIVTFDLHVKTEKLIEKYLYIRCKPHFNAEKNVAAIFGTAMNITKIKKAENEIRRTKILLEKIINNLREVVFLIDPESREIIMANDAVFDVFGYEKDEVIGKNTELLYLSKTDYINFGNISEEKLSETGVYQTKTKLKKKDGSSVDTENLVKAIDDEKGWPYGVVSVVRDITDLNNYIEKLEKTKTQLSSLFINLDNIREEERKNLARELHDELGQVLTSIKMNLSLLKNNIGSEDFDDQKILDEIEDMTGIIDESKQNIKSLIRRLRPEYLDNLGLVPALNNLIKKFTDKTGINIEFLSNKDEIELDTSVENVVYRVIQEALTNVAKHSKAESVEVNLTKTKRKLLLNIIDNGIGIKSEEYQKEDSFGIIGMRERLGKIKGTLEIKENKPKGTWLNVKIELQ